MLFVYPTETCYGLGCNISDEEGIKKIYSLKKRDSSKPLIVLVNSISMWKKIAYVEKKALELAKKYWPAPLTIIQRKKPSVSDLISKDTIAVRWSPHPVPNKIISIFNEPIVSTSANISGKSNPYSINDVPKRIRYNVDEIFDWGRLKRKKPSTVVLVQDGKVKLIRSGPIEI